MKETASECRKFKLLAEDSQQKLPPRNHTIPSRYQELPLFSTKATRTPRLQRPVRLISGVNHSVDLDGLKFFKKFLVQSILKNVKVTNRLIIFLLKL